MASNLAFLSAAELLRGYRAKTLNPVDVVIACYERIEKLNPTLNAFCLVDKANAVKAAQESAARWAKGEPLGMLDGVPTSVKDLLITNGWPTLRGSKAINPDQSWTEDAPCVARLREAGAILMGKTTTPELGHKGVTHNPLTGITRNPWNPDTTPGGSSGGGSVAAAAGMAALNLGTDGGGSVRIPASFTGIFALKPTFGVVPAFPISPFGTLAHVGPMTRTVEDAALMLQVIGRPDVRDWYSPRTGDIDYTTTLRDGVRGLRIAYARTINNEPVDAEIAALVHSAVEKFKDLGANVTEVTLDMPDVKQIFQKHWYVGAATVLQSYSSDQQSVMDRTLLEEARWGEKLPLMSYTQAVLARAKLGVQMRAFHQKYDLLLLPTEPIAAFKAGLEVPEGQAETEFGWTEWTPFTYPFNLTQQPAASIPCGLTKAGLPAGLQIVGDLFADALVLRAAYAYEQVVPIPLAPMVKQ
eukprot:TRINITY_DN216_c0_g1_i1.p1 TRINITY_DN216_c0_g1~~TRINITY_DN216_c0_g1_i1.p1  ORF type:complete len:470 (-),score=108.19 TRINITY_DN216_c0_g1_i1:42-1451(-)